MLLSSAIFIANFDTSNASALDFDRLVKPYKDNNQAVATTHIMPFLNVGQYAINVLYAHIRIPLNLSIIEDSLHHAEEQFEIIQAKTKNAVNEKDLNEVIKEKRQVFNLIKDKYDSIKSTFPNQTPVTASYLDGEDHRTKRFIGALLAGVGTLFGITNAVQLQRINNQVQHNTDAISTVIDITRILADHQKQFRRKLTQLEVYIRNKEQHDIGKMAAFVDTMIFHLDMQINVFKDTMQQAMNHRLAINALTRSDAAIVVQHVKDTAHDLGLKSMINSHHELFQLELSYMLQENQMVLILHVPMVDEQNLLNMRQYLPVPFNQDIFNNRSLIPILDDFDIIAYNDHSKYKLVNSKDLSLCDKMGEIFFCKGRTSIQTEFTHSCLGAIVRSDGENINKRCRFQVKPINEQVFEISRGEWLIFTDGAHPATMDCKNKRNNRDLPIHNGAKIRLSPGCSIRLSEHILYAENEVFVSSRPSTVEIRWDASTLFKAISREDLELVTAHLMENETMEVDIADIRHRVQTLQTKLTLEDSKDALNKVSTLDDLIQSAHDITSPMIEWTKVSVYAIPLGVSSFLIIGFYLIWRYRLAPRFCPARRYPYCEPRLSWKTTDDVVKMHKAASRVDDVDMTGKEAEQINLDNALRYSAEAAARPILKRHSKDRPRASTPDLTPSAPSSSNMSLYPSSQHLYMNKTGNTTNISGITKYADMESEPPSRVQSEHDGRH